MNNFTRFLSTFVTADMFVRLPEPIRPRLPKVLNSGPDPEDVLGPNAIRAFENVDIVGFAGYKRSGKDTAGAVLERSFGFKPVKLTTPVKEVVKTVFEFESISGDSKDEIDPFWGMSPRDAMQLVATDLFQNRFDIDVWSKSLVRRMRNDDADKFVVTDLRFPRQCKFLEAIGGEVYYISRPSTVPDLSYWKKTLTRLFPNIFNFGSEYHPSETVILDSAYADSGYCRRIDNVGSLADFEAKVIATFEVTNQPAQQ